MKPKSYRRKAPKLSESSKTKPVVPDPLAIQMVQQVLAELPELMAVAVVDVASGISLASHSNSIINPDTAATFNAEVVKLKQKAMAALQLDDEHLDDILVTLSNQLHLLKLASNGRKFIYLAVQAHTTNLAMAREVLRVQAEQLN